MSIIVPRERTPNEADLTSRTCLVPRRVLADFGSSTRLTERKVACLSLPKVLCANAKPSHVPLRELLIGLFFLLSSDTFETPGYKAASRMTDHLPPRYTGPKGGHIREFDLLNARFFPQTNKLAAMVKALGSKTISKIARSGPESQVRYDLQFVRLH